MKASLVSLPLIVALFTAVPLTHPGRAQSVVTGGASISDRTSDVPFRIVGDVTVISGPHQERQVSVFIEPRFFTLERVKNIFLRLAEVRPSEDYLSINAVSNAEQLEEALHLFAEVQSFPFGNLPPRPNRDAGPEDPPLSAHYFRGNNSEFLNYYNEDGKALNLNLKGTSPDAPSGDPITDLVYASMHGREEVVDDLLRSGANPNVKSREGGVALVEAAYWGSGHPEVVERLLNAGANIDQTSSTGWTALMAAVYGNRSQTIDLLLRRGANINMIGRDGRNALIIAASRQNVDALRKLLAHRADPNVIDGYGKTALSIAEQQHDEESIRILRKAGAVDDRALRRN